MYIAQDLPRTCTLTISQRKFSKIRNVINVRIIDTCVGHSDLVQKAQRTKSSRSEGLPMRSLARRAPYTSSLVLFSTNSNCIMNIVYRNSAPAIGGAARDPSPHPRKKMGEIRPVTSILLAAQEKAAPNCHDTRRPTRAAPG